MKQCGVYRVVGRRASRGHEPGEEFTALLEHHAEQRAIYRGSIERIGEVTPRPEVYSFPDGWLQEE